MSLPALMAIGDRQRWGGTLDAWINALARAVEAQGAGAPGLIVQIREKDLSDRELLHLVRAARRRLPPEVPLLVNGRLDIALAAGADGAHLPANGVPLAALRQRFGDGVILGRAAHHQNEVLAAARDGAEYITLSPVFPTISKPRAVALGIDIVAQAAAALTADARQRGVRPPALYALGGVGWDDLPALGAAGTTGAAAIGLFSPADEESRRGATLAELLTHGETSFRGAASVSP